MALVGSGFATDHQKALYWSAAIFGTILLIGAALHIFGERMMATTTKVNGLGRLPHAHVAYGPRSPAWRCWSW